MRASRMANCVARRRSAAPRLPSIAQSRELRAFELLDQLILLGQPCSRSRARSVSTRICASRAADLFLPLRELGEASGEPAALPAVRIQRRVLGRVLRVAARTRVHGIIEPDRLEQHGQLVGVIVIEIVRGSFRHSRELRSVCSATTLGGFAPPASGAHSAGTVRPRAHARRAATRSAMMTDSGRVFRSSAAK